MTFKETVHPNIKITSLSIFLVFTHTHVILNSYDFVYFVYNTKKMIGRSDSLSPHSLSLYGKRCNESKWWLRLTLNLSLNFCPWEGIKHHLTELAVDDGANRSLMVLVSRTASRLLSGGLVNGGKKERISLLQRFSSSREWASSCVSLPLTPTVQPRSKFSFTTTQSSGIIHSLSLPSYQGQHRDPRWK